MQEYLKNFRALQISKAELQQAIGEDLYNVECKKPCFLKCSHVIGAIQLYRSHTITLKTLVDWVNVVWFTELFAFTDEETDSIVSVLEVLETMDEDEVVVSDAELDGMVAALTSNIEYIA